MNTAPAEIAGTASDQGARTARPLATAHRQLTAHRGDVERFRENTLDAVQAAIEAGADFVEIDVHVTRDGHVVLLHDRTLERLWGLNRLVSEIEWAEVAALGGGTERIPLLSDALALVAETPSTLLIDVEDPECAEPAAAVVRAFGPAARVAWCGDLDAMRTVRALDGDASVWLPWNRRDLPPAGLLAELRPDVVNSEYPVLSRELIDAAHAEGLRVACWTVDDEDAMRWVLALGADAVTTNRLSALRRVVAEGPDAWSAAPRPARIASDELAAAIVVAHELAHWAVEYTRGAEIGIVGAKAHAADHVTAVDLAVERRVREVIAERFPGHLVVGEELGGAARPGVPTWYVDPVDGTANLANGVPWTAFSLALAVDREPFVAVVGDVWRGQVFAAVAGLGAEVDGRRLDLRAGAGDVPDGITGTVVGTELLAYEPWPGLDAFVEGLRGLFCTMRIMGSSTLTLAGVAAGRGAGSVIERFSPIDHLAAVLIVREAGGVLLDDAGNATLWPDGGILAARPEAAAELYEVWSAARGAAQGDARDALGVG
ncbi:inositol monophosphatase family protein [Sinomonas sp. ASV322]|uniref:inositol monophosphatase family protein n=1 Tax=Sinomonas sp. ASV322 TaxID=3041920 RepID=UPI0027DD56A9|nr:inositol monophosphatase family protein [Sinomonas sp. ASV322]MDQ4504162.1 inositol monophosphatase family protein [Sinomonas sp. ASV322]